MRFLCWYVNWYCPVQIFVCDYIVKMSWVHAATCHLQTALYHSRYPGPLALTSFLPPLSPRSLNLRSWVHAVDVSIGAGYPT